MRLVFVSHSPGTGGAEHSLATLIREALARDHEVLVSLPIADEQRIRTLLPASARLEVVSHRWVRMMQGSRPRLSGPLRIVVGVWDARKFATWARSQRADVIIVNSTTIPQASLAARMAGVPAVTMIREAIKTNPALPSFLPKRVIAWLIRTFSTSTIAVSEYASEQLASASFVVHPEVPLPAARPRRELTNGVRLVMAGTLSEEKGQQDAVEAIRLARERGADVRLEFYGQAAADRLGRLNDLIATSGLADVVMHRGESRAMMDIFAAADATLVCSGNEAFGRVTAESINAGTPVLGYAKGGTSEILREGGGLLCDPNPEALADAIVRLDSEPELLGALRRQCDDRISAGGAGGRATVVVDLIEQATAAMGTGSS